MRLGIVCCLVSLGLLTTGCGNTPATKGDVAKGGAAKDGNAPTSTPGNADAEIKARFANLQTAVKEKNGEKIWDLIAADCRQDADRIARTIKETSAKAEPAQKAELAKKVGVPEDKLAALDGKSFLGSKLFIHYDEHDEIPDVKTLDKIETKETSGKIFYKDPDAPEKTVNMRVLREDGQWRFFLLMPKAPELDAPKDVAKKPESKAETDLKAAFVKLQEAVKARSGEKIWEMITVEARQNADKIAISIKETSAKADAAKKAELLKKLELPEAKLATLDGKTFLESRLFYRFNEHHEIPDVTGLDKIDVKENAGTISYKDPDNDAKTLTVRVALEDGQWRFHLLMPKAPE